MSWTMNWPHRGTRCVAEVAGRDTDFCIVVEMSRADGRGLPLAPVRGEPAKVFACQCVFAKYRCLSAKPEPLQGCGAGTQISCSCSRHLDFLASAPERFVPLKTKNHCTELFVQLACPINFVCGTGNQIPGSGSGSTI